MRKKFKKRKCNLNLSERVVPVMRGIARQASEDSKASK